MWKGPETDLPVGGFVPDAWLRETSNTVIGLEGGGKKALAPVRRLLRRKSYPLLLRLSTVLSQVEKSLEDVDRLSLIAPSLASGPAPSLVTPVLSSGVSQPGTASLTKGAVRFSIPGQSSRGAAIASSYRMGPRKRIWGKPKKVQQFDDDRHCMSFDQEDLPGDDFLSGPVTYDETDQAKSC